MGDVPRLPAAAAAAAVSVTAQIYREVRLHSGLQHENIVTMHAAWQEGDKVVMVQVRHQRGTMHPRIHPAAFTTTARGPASLR